MIRKEHEEHAEDTNTVMQAKKSLQGKLRHVPTTTQQQRRTKRTER
jgi:hypothetical protein